MLSVGTAVMVLSIVVGVAALAVAGVMSSAARTTGRRVRTAMALDAQHAGPHGPAGDGATPHQADAPYQPAWQEAPYQPAEEEAAYQPAEEEAPYQPAEEGAAYDPAGQGAPYDPADQRAAYEPVDQGAGYEPAEHEAPYEPADQDAPRWVVLSAAVSGAGLLLGLLIVMIASIP